MNFYEIVPLITEINQVTLIGTLVSDAFTLKSGAKSVNVRTYDAEMKKR